MPRKMNKQIQVRMTEDEFEEYEKLVVKSKMNKQNYNSKCLLDKKIIVIDGILELAAQIRKIGVNINQTVHLANELKSINDDQIDRIKRKQDEVLLLLSDFVNRIKS